VTETSIRPITFIDPQPQPGDPDRVWFAESRSGKGLYAVTRTSCSCPAGKYREGVPCSHRKHLLVCLGEDTDG
jgi:hypothetical protein